MDTKNATLFTCIISIDNVIPSLNCSTTVGGIEMDLSSCGSLLLRLTVFPFNPGTIGPKILFAILMYFCVNELCPMTLVSIALPRSLLLGQANTCCSSLSFLALVQSKLEYYSFLPSTVITLSTAPLLSASFILRQYRLVIGQS